MHAHTRSHPLHGDPDLLLLREALGAVAGESSGDDAALRLISREPLGEGSVSGFAQAADSPEQIWYVDTSRLPVRAETGLATGSDPARPDARIWTHPADPHLPALAATAFGHAVTALLARLGLVATGELTMVGYRPGRRAVLRAGTDSGDVWLKVVRPRRLDRIVGAHHACVEAGLPVPTLRGWAPEGLLVLDSAAGAPAAECGWQPHQLLDSVDGLRARIAAISWDRPAPSIADRLDWYAGRAGDHVEAQRLVAGIRTLLANAPVREHTVVHGDLHFGQLFLADEDADISGMIDVDTLGRGDAAEDSAAFIAHAVASARLTGAEHRARIWGLADAALERWDDRRVRALTGIHLLGQANSARDHGDMTGAQMLCRGAQSIVDGDPAEPARSHSEQT
ncbi:phosphotransferase [Microbacterium esteraromaticum]|uniref:phosphotransferase n=1 Tax=Microbacterium esteraromaticum TaxID=57043 RepID=UPI001C943F9D|nr:phosphotransferase [Microbacterium esteraromaticum]MBY6061362.1 phosphotransferase [Microbacterium esteraromaticum]